MAIPDLCSLDSYLDSSRHNNNKGTNAPDISSAVKLLKKSLPGSFSRSAAVLSSTVRLPSNKCVNNNTTTTTLFDTQAHSLKQLRLNGTFQAKYRKALNQVCKGTNGPPTIPMQVCTTLEALSATNEHRGMKGADKKGCVREEKRPASAAPSSKRQTLLSRINQDFDAATQTYMHNLIERNCGKWIDTKQPLSWPCNAGLQEGMRPRPDPKIRKKKSRAPLRSVDAVDGRTPENYFSIKKQFFTGPKEVILDEPIAKYHSKIQVTSEEQATKHINTILATTFEKKKKRCFSPVADEVQDARTIAQMSMYQERIRPTKEETLVGWGTGGRSSPPPSPLHAAEDGRPFTPPPPQATVSTSPRRWKHNQISHTDGSPLATTKLLLEGNVNALVNARRVAAHHSHLLGQAGQDTAPDVRKRTITLVEEEEETGSATSHPPIEKKVSIAEISEKKLGRDSLRAIGISDGWFTPDILTEERQTCVQSDTDSFCDSESHTF